MSSVLRVFACLFALTFPAFGAGIETQMKRQLDGPNAQLVIHLTGPIAEGDAEKIRQIYLRSGLASNDDYADLVLSLDSPGGSFAEALKIARVLNENGIGTYVAEGASCLSACAVAFMAGSDINTQITGRDRSIHPQARLGFHAPSLAVPDSGEVPAQQLGAAFAVALASISGILEAEQYLGMSRSLLVRMIATPPDDMFFVTTTGMAGMWDIGVDAPAPDLRLTDQALSDTCANLHAWTADRQIVGPMGGSVTHPPSVGDPGFRVERHAFTVPHNPTRQMYWMPAINEYSINCHVHQWDWSNTNRGQWDKSIFLVAGVTHEGPQSVVQGLQSRNLRPTWLPWIAALPADTPLSSLRGPGTRLSPAWPIAPNSAEGLCREFGLFAKLVSESPCRMVLEDGAYRFSGGPEIDAFQQKWDVLMDWEGVQASSLSPEGRHAQATCIFDQRDQETLCFQQ
ncbi:hypothetical protein KUV73_01975 [Mameliella alba]|nr:hypothetical protein [Mameliella alba]MBY6168085.1 hypothetical protein [Mameliella alba]MBY6173106.1 hypothetical protein [Mameliella alba]